MFSAPKAPQERRDEEIEAMPPECVRPAAEILAETIRCALIQYCNFSLRLLVFLFAKLFD